MNRFQQWMVETIFCPAAKFIAAAYLFICMASVTHLAHGEDYQELLLFPIVHTEYHLSNTSNEKPEAFFAGDAFFALNYEQTRFLGEFYLASTEIELERAQFGYQFANKQFAWIGRFHAPLDFWNNQYSHASFLQTSIHRPSIVEYEDHGGVLPTHMAGLMLEGEINIGESAFEYNFVFGSGTELADEGLAAVRLFEKESYRDTNNLALRIGFRPDELSTTQYGGFLTRTKIVSDGTDLQFIDQIVGGLYFHYNVNEIRLIGSVMNVMSQLNYSAFTTPSRFVAGYIHGEYELTESVVLYGRVENSFGARGDPLIEIFDEFKTRAFSAGTRFDFNPHNAISIEIGRVYEYDHVSHPVTLQWSAVYP